MRNNAIAVLVWLAGWLAGSIDADWLRLVLSETKGETETGLPSATWGGVAS